MTIEVTPFGSIYGHLKPRNGAFYNTSLDFEYEQKYTGTGDSQELLVGYGQIFNLKLNYDESNNKFLGWYSDRI